MRGRKSTPDHIKRMTGNPGKRPASTRAPALPCERPAPPAGVSAEVLARWHYVVPLLETARKLTALSGPALLSYCAACADLEAVAALEARMGKARLKPRRSNWRTLVHLRAVRKAAETAVRTFEENYGLTPASASRVAVPHDPSRVNRFADFLRRKPVIPVFSFPQAVIPADAPQNS